MLNALCTHTQLLEQLAQANVDIANMKLKVDDSAELQDSTGHELEELYDVVEGLEKERDDLRAQLAKGADGALKELQRENAELKLNIKETQKAFLADSKVQKEEIKRLKDQLAATTK